MAWEALVWNATHAKADSDAPCRPNLQALYGPHTAPARTGTTRRTKNPMRDRLNAQCNGHTASTQTAAPRQAAPPQTARHQAALRQAAPESPRHQNPRRRQQALHSPGRQAARQTQQPCPPRYSKPPPSRPGTAPRWTSSSRSAPPHTLSSPARTRAANTRTP